MAQKTSVQSPGLWTSPNRLSAPEGSLRVAENVWLRTRDNIEPRRGFDLTYIRTDVVTSADLRVCGGAQLLPVLTANTTNFLSLLDPTTFAGYIVEDAGGATAPVVNAWSPPDPSLMRHHFQPMLGRMYATTNTGPVRSYGQGTQIKRAGAPVPELNWSESHVRVDAAGFLGQNRSVAFRAELVTLSPDGREIRSQPSARMVITNPSASVIGIGNAVRAANVVTCTTPAAHGFKTGDIVALTGGDPLILNGSYTVTAVPAYNQFQFASAGANGASTFAITAQIGTLCQVELVEAHVYFQDYYAQPGTSTIFRVYRTEVSAAGGVPSEDYYLILERYLTGGETVSATVFDNTPDALLGPIAYFSASADTELKSKNSPPWCKTLAVIGASGNRMAYANTRERHNRFIQLLAVGGTSGLQLGDVITVSHTHAGYGTINQTVNIVNNKVNGNDALLFSGGSVSLDIQNTALGICDAINTTASNLSYQPMVRARYVSSIDDAPGQILLEALYEDDIAFTVDVTAARRTAFNPQLLSTSDGIAYPARLFLSEVNEPDAVPPLQYIDVGDQTEAIYRVIQLMDNTLVLKASSAWILSGEWPSIQVQRLDAAMQLVSPDTVAVVSGQVFALTTQGVVVVGTSGVGLVGNPIETDLEFIQAGTNRRLPFAFGYESEKAYILGVPASATDTTCRALYVYNTLLKCWTKWTIPTMSGWYQRSTNSIALGAADRKALHTERKTFTRADYKDELLRDHTNAAVSFSYTKPTAGQLQVTGGGAKASLIAAGDILYVTPNNTRRPSFYARVLGVDTSTGIVTVADCSSVASGTFLCYKHFNTAVEWLPDVVQDPAKAKMGKEVVFHFSSFAGYATGLVQSELSPSAVQTKAFNRPGFGMMSWGTAQYGDPSGPRNERIAYRWDTARGAYPIVRLETSVAETFFKLSGKTFEFDATGSIDKR